MSHAPGQHRRTSTSSIAYSLCKSAKIEDRHPAVRHGIVAPADEPRSYPQISPIHTDQKVGSIRVLRAQRGVLASQSMRVASPSCALLTAHANRCKSPSFQYRSASAAFASPVVMAPLLHSPKAGLPAEAAPSGVTLVEQPFVEKCSTRSALEIALERARSFLATEARIPGQRPGTIPGGVRRHPPVVLS